MKPIFEEKSFYPFTYCDHQNGYYEIMRYNIIKHKWISLKKIRSTQEWVEKYVYDLNSDAGIISERFIVGYKD
ncbi:MAG: hypothetical protein HUJ61_05925 [Bacilli bacterium]|nr:hypothetical protein [Bacilli bacterium]